MAIMWQSLNDWMASAAAYTIYNNISSISDCLDGGDEINCDDRYYYLHLPLSNNNVLVQGWLLMQ